VSDFTVVIAPAADDIRSAFIWYRKRNPLAAEACRAAVFDTIDRIAEAPLIPPPDVEGNRKRMLRRFPYAVYYAVSIGIVTILAEAHHRREPAYSRTSEG
jgi:plasmid stabilization system protein ParE